MNRYGRYQIGTLIYNVFEMNGSTIALIEEEGTEFITLSLSIMKPFDFVSTLMRNNAKTLDTEFKGDVGRFVNEGKTVLDKLLVAKNKGRYLDDQSI